MTNPQINQEPMRQIASSNKILIKGLITGALILLMLIPVVFVAELIHERQERQRQVVAEVSSKWATSQTVTGPYIIIPYNETYVNAEKKPVVIRKSVILLPEKLSVTGDVLPEERLRSIYTVLLYKSRIKTTGFFKINLPADIDSSNLVWNEARICIGLSDFKGIEEKVSITFKGDNNDLIPGIPVNEIDSAGLSTRAVLSLTDLNKELAFSLDLKLKGSGKLHFLPLCGNGVFELKSSWTDPSFDGNTLPTERTVNDKGFAAKWNFNKANLPFSTVLKDVEINKWNYAFGLSILQPADHYSKTSRSVKYAILFIGLTFSLFFIIELLQKKPVHPVQYVLIGLALVIFYSLLLSFSEYMHFNYAYLIASAATILLITLYTKSHFKNWMIAGVFAGLLSSLYGFIFILIQLEDTALLVGSIGLFIILALVMYASRKVNWYGGTTES